ncbi:hypothetical protein HZP16_09820 [Elizabethkingia anophelis]|nr:hypothetical protein [Elizabethkingia anophelis]
MSIPKYIYVDDENGTPEISTLHGFNDLKIIEVERFPLSEFREFSSLKIELIKRIKEQASDGLILDLRLDGNGSDRTEFNATALTSELRSVAARGEIASFPIILCSTESNIKQTYDTDKTSHDLFDYKINKSNEKPGWEKMSQKLASLAKGYKWLQSQKRENEEIFGISDITNLDERIIERISNFSVPYDYTHFVVKHFFHQTNPLISEKVLAARLGIDLAHTPAETWGTLKNEILSDIKYKGVFSDGWQRWWADKLIIWFEEISGENLAFINAEKRTEILINEYGLKELVVSEPLKFCNSTEFWSICEAYKVPIDPLEAFRIFTTVEIKPWEEYKYISLLAVLDRKGVERGLKPHSSEIEKIEYTKELLGI